MLFEEAVNKDLIWNIGDKRYKESSVGFLDRFKESLCLFSQTVSQLYSNYDLFSVPTDLCKIVAMPNPYAYHDTYNDIPKHAVKPTGIYVIPTELQKKYLPGDLCIAFRSASTREIQTMALDKGLRAIKRKYENQGKFLPVIINKDLMFRKDNKPVMHLHRLDLKELSHLSKFVRTDITSAVEEKMSTLI